MFLTAKCQVLIKFNVKNSKVFEQKGNLLNFKTNIDPMAPQAPPSLAPLGQLVVVWQDLAV